MPDTAGVATPNDEVLPDDAIDTALENVEQEVVDTRAIKAEKEAEELRHRLRAQEEMIGELRKTTQQQSEMLSELVGGMRDAKERGFSYEVDRLRSVMRKAVADADQDTFAAAERELFTLMSQHAAADPKPKKEEKAATPQAAVDPAVAAWAAENPWVNDRKMYREALAIETNIHEDKPWLSTAERLKEVTAEMARRHPQKFANQARTAPPIVSRPGPQAATRQAKKELTIADLDEDSKAALAAIKRVDPKFTDEMYLKARQKRLAQQKEMNRL